MIALAVNAAEEQLMNGTASSQVITHYLKLGSTKTRLENEKLQAENDLLKAKIEALNSQKRTEELYAEALKAMRDYSGMGENDEY
jgi:cell division protein FtsB